jgi:hypothetical protein
MILRHVDPLLDNDREMSNYTRAVVPQTSMFPREQLHCNKETVLCTRSVPRCYKHDMMS